MAAYPENHLTIQINDESANGFCAVNSHMISSKIAHFLNEVRSCINEFIMIFYVGIGFNKRDAGFINGIQLFGAIVASPFWAYIADKHGIHKFIVSFLCVMALMTMSTLPLLSVIYGDKQKNVCPYKVDNTTNIGIADKYSWGNRDILYYSMWLQESSRQHLMEVSLALLIVVSSFELKLLHKKLIMDIKGVLDP